jgi:hypothetical protein
VHLSVNKRRIYKTACYTWFHMCVLPILWNVFEGTAFVWNVGTKWGKLLSKQSNSLHNGSKNHFPAWQSKTELIDFKDHACIYIYIFYLLRFTALRVHSLGQTVNQEFYLTVLLHLWTINAKEMSGSLAEMHLVYSWQHFSVSMAVLKPWCL